MAAGMQISFPKSCLFAINLQDAFKQSVITIFPLELRDLCQGLTYLGYLLRPNAYLVNDWPWIVRKVESRILCWQNQKLSLGGRLVLLNSVLENLPIYWFSLAHFPMSILQLIQKLMFNFLWKGQSQFQGCHLVSWEIISRP